jgi:hypothetical protein
MLKKQKSILSALQNVQILPPRFKSHSAGIMISTLDEIVGMSEILDIIFDLTGIHDVRKELRKKLQATNNMHTVVAPETIVNLILY